jgi:hypothetical protein
MNSKENPCVIVEGEIRKKDNQPTFFSMIPVICRISLYCRMVVRAVLERKASEIVPVKAGGIVTGFERLHCGGLYARDTFGM